MTTLYFLIGAMALITILLFLGFILLLWGLRQLLIIKNQNDALVSLLDQISINIWNEAYMKAGLQEDMGGRHDHHGAEVRAA